MLARGMVTEVAMVEAKEVAERALARCQAVSRRFRAWRCMPWFKVLTIEEFRETLVLSIILSSRQSEQVPYVYTSSWRESTAGLQA